jgi:hypothetical protein
MVLNAFQKDSGRAFENIFAVLINNKRSLFESVELNELTCFISDECNEMIFDIFLTVSLLTLALGCEGRMS